MRYLLERQVTLLQPKNINKICHDSIQAIEKGELKNFWRFKSKVKEEFDNLITDMGFNKDDFSFEDLDSSQANRSACLLALYGFKFMNAVETVWETATEEQLKEIDLVVAMLTHEMNRRY